MLVVAGVFVVVLLVLAGVLWRNQTASETADAPATTAPAADAVGEPGTPIVSAPNVELIGPIWKLLELVAPDGTITTVTDPSLYTLELLADGRANVKADCSIGAGKYLADATRLWFDLTFDPTACAPESLYDRYSRALSVTGTYAIADRGLTVMAPGADSMRFTRSDVAPPVAPGAPPTAVISIPNEAVVGQLVTFDATGSQSEAEIVSYAWSFGDGSRSMGAQVTYAYDLAGTYLVELAVVDGNRQIGTSTASIKVSPPEQTPPTAALSGPAKAMVGEQVTFDASASVAGTSPIESYAWNLGNNETRPAGGDAKITIAYSSPGTYDVTVTVTDAGDLSDSADARIVIEAPAQPTPAPPMAVISGPSQTTAGELVTFDGSSSRGPEPIVAYLWDFGDGTKANAVSIAHAYSGTGQFVVTLTVVDTLGARGTATVTVTVGPAVQTPPTASISGPDATTAGQPVTLDASGSRPGSSPIVSYAWNLGDASATSLGASATLTGSPKYPGVYQVFVTVTDQNGLSGSASHELRVNAGLTGIVWEMAGSLPAAPVTLGLQGAELGGSGGCNAYSGRFTATPDGQLTTTAIVTTGAVCTPDIAAQESTYLAALESAQRYAIDVDTLTITHATGTLQFVARGAIPSQY